MAEVAAAIAALQHARASREYKRYKEVLGPVYDALFVLLDMHMPSASQAIPPESPPEAVAATVADLAARLAASEPEPAPELVAAPVPEPAPAPAPTPASSAEERPREVSPARALSPSRGGRAGAADAARVRAKSPETVHEDTKPLVPRAPAAPAAGAPERMSALKTAETAVRQRLRKRDAATASEVTSRIRRIATNTSAEGLALAAPLPAVPAVAGYQHVGRVVTLNRAASAPDPTSNVTVHVHL